MQTPEPVYEMLWDCSSCGTRKLLGKTHRHCPECGAAQDPARRYFPPEDEKIAVADHVYQGVDRTCGYCSAPNSKAARFCVQCGAAVSDADAAVPLVGEQPAAQPGRARSPGRRKMVWITLAVVLVGGITALVVSRCWTSSKSLQVIGHSWERTIDIERLAPKAESSWCDELPGDAYDVSRTQKERSRKKIPDGETCSTRKVDNGDGTFRQVTDCKPKFREEPVHGDFCTYRVNRWQTERTISASGGLADTPYWPSANTPACTTVGCEREGKRSETYEVELRDPGGETHRCAYGEERWRSMADGSRWKADVRVMTGSLSCDSLSAAR